MSGASAAALVLGAAWFAGWPAAPSPTAPAAQVNAAALDDLAARLASVESRVAKPAAATPESALSALVDRWLMLHEVARFAPTEPAAAAVEARLAALRARAGDAETVTRRLSEAGRAASYLTAWVRDDLRIAAYLEQRFASTGAPSEPDVTAYTQRQAAALEAAGLTGDAALAAARARLVQERRRELIADWLADLRRRTSVVTFAPRP